MAGRREEMMMKGTMTLASAIGIGLLTPMGYGQFVGFGAVSSSPLAQPAQPHAGVGDFDGDGLADFIYLNQNGEIAFRFGNNDPELSTDETVLPYLNGKDVYFGQHREIHVAGTHAGDAVFVSLPGFPEALAESSALAISADGSVIVGCATSAQGFELPVLWRNDILQTVPLSAGYNAGFARDVSGDGSTIVGQLNHDGDAYDGRAFSSQSGLTTVYNFLPSGLRTSVANAVSRDGRVIAGWTNGITTGFNGLRIENGIQSELFDLPGGVDNDAACDSINSDGTVISGRGVSVAAGGDRYEACIWAPGPNPIPLGDLPGGRFTSQAQAMNAAGTIFVGFANSPLVTPGEYGEATMWKNNALPVSLGDLPGGLYSSYAFSVTDYGRVVVGYGSTDRGQEAFVWTEDHGIERLEDAVFNRWGLSLPEGWILTRALDLSSDGTTVVGRGISPDGIVQGWRITVPCWNPELIVEITDDQEAPAMGEACFSVDSVGSAEPSYQWQVSEGDGTWQDLIDGVTPALGNVEGAWSSTLCVSNLEPSMTWNVRVVLDNPCGSTTSESRLLVVDDICIADFSAPYGSLDFFDVSAFLSAFNSMNPAADLSKKGVFDFFDVSAFLQAYSTGCP